MRPRSAGGPGGQRVEPLEPRTLLAAVVSDNVPVTIPFGTTAPTVRIVPAPGQRMTLTLRGPGRGTTTVPGGAVDVVLDGTTAQTTVMIKSFGRTAARLGRVIVHGPLTSFRAPAADVAGDVTFDGPVAEVVIGTTARGGTAVLDFGGRQTLDRAGNVQTLLDGAALADRLRQAGIDFTAHDVQ